MKHKRYQFGKYAVNVFDDVFGLSDREFFYKFFSISKFQIGWGDSVELQDGGKKFFFSLYSEQDIHNSKFFQTLTDKNHAEINTILDGLRVSKAVVNLTRPTESYQAHSHNTGMSLVYYANLRWQEEWAGKLCFSPKI